MLVPATDRERVRVLATNSAEFYARFAPDGTEEGLLTATLWTYWGFAFDDARCDHGPLAANPGAFLPMAGRVQHAAESASAPPPSADRYAAALHDVVARMRSHATPTQVRRFLDANRHWLYCVAWQVGNRCTGRMPDLAEYLALRMGSSGGPPTIALLEVTTGVEVPARELDHPAVRALTEMTWLVAALDNDLHSHRKEVAETETDQNVVTVLVRQNGCSTEQALVEAVALRDRVMGRFLWLRDRVRARASAELACYLDCLGHAIRGNIDWAANVPRYLAADTPDGVPSQVPIVVTDEPSDTRADPPPIPAIAWWWDRLDP